MGIFISIIPLPSNLRFFSTEEKHSHGGPGKYINQKKEAFLSDCSPFLMIFSPFPFPIFFLNNIYSCLNIQWKECIQDGYSFVHWSGLDVFVYFSHHLVTIPPPGTLNSLQPYYKHSIPVLDIYGVSTVRGGGGDFVLTPRHHNTRQGH